ncbi:hypothetical protein [Anaplasma phagocytophilum]|uniref:hypothetical protein n=1 Tax=Anaplasma phagocytophilum TaxID=948 RepID=UPI00201AEF86
MYKDLLLDKVRTLFTLLRLLKSPTLTSMIRFVGRSTLKARAESMLSTLLLQWQKMKPKGRLLYVVMWSILEAVLQVVIVIHPRF